MIETSAERSGQKVFITYSHDSPELVERVRQLASRLRSQGVDVEIDQYVESPPEGWPRWMERQLVGAAHVLVICTEGYARKIQGEHKSKGGLGATWEGAIVTQEIYEGKRPGTKYIPVILQADDHQHIPIFLRSATWYNVADDEGYLSLYRRLTGQPKTPRPELGPVVELNREDLPVEAHKWKADGSGSSELFLLIPTVGIRVLPNVTVVAGEDVRLEVPADTPEVTALLSNLATRKDELFCIGFGTSAGVVRLIEAVQQRGPDGERWIIRGRSVPSDYGGGIMEISTEWYSADQIAELRARRILLNEPLPKEGRDPLNQGVLESFVRGRSASPIKVNDSPIPMIYQDLKGDPARFMSIARLFCASFLVLSGTVETISKLELELTGQSLHVVFRGQRRRVYVNVDPPHIEVDGSLDLSQPVYEESKSVARS